MIEKGKRLLAKKKNKIRLLWELTSNRRKEKEEMEKMRQREKIPKEMSNTE